MLVGLSVCLTIPLLASATNSAGNIRKISGKPKKAQLGGKAIRESTKEVSSITSQRRYSNHLSSAKTARRPTVMNRHPLACPTNFLKDGVYLWCDPDGIWTMFWRGKERFAFTATVTAKKVITVMRTVRAKTTASKTGTTQVKISGNSKPNGGVVQFTSTDDSIEFEVLIDGKKRPKRVYVGSQLKTPEQFPLRLITRQLVPHKILPNKISTTDNKPTESVRLNFDVSSKPTQAVIPVTPTQRSGSSGKNIKKQKGK